MPQINLTPAQRKEKRADAHHLDPVVMIGGEGLTPAVVKETDAALTSHGLIKVRVLGDDRTARDEMLAKLCDELSAAPIQHIGKLLVLWRPVPEKVKAEREDARPGPRVVKIVKFSKSGNGRPQINKVKVMGNERVTQGGEIKRVKKRGVTTSVKKRAAE
ncbi:MAG: YhbY family RNA-binding protein [Rubrivivax sp.]|nr:MAG: YhbY family RNA-binding protein [Rubrivivax sp.]